MVQRFLFVTFLVSLLVSSGTIPVEMQCSRSPNYRGESLHPGVNLDEFPAEFDLSGDLPPDLVARLEAVLDSSLESTQTPGMTAAVGIPDRGIWSSAKGFASTEARTPVDNNSRFWWASAGKMFTSAVILQLVGEGKLTLDRTIDTWFPNYPQSPSITIANLLAHTGGVFSFQQDLRLQERTGYKTPEELIAISAERGADFCPGEYWHYSNTGYVMLAKIIEAIEAQPFPEVVRSRIIDRLGLTQTIALGPQELPPNLAIGHVDGKPDADFVPSLVFGAGNIVASSEDMVVFLAVLLSGRVYPENLLRGSLEELYPMFNPGTYYGRGIMLYDIDRDSDSVNWVGHGGGSASVKAIVAYDRDRRVFVSVAVNADVPVEAIAYRLVEVVREYRELTEF